MKYYLVRSKTQVYQVHKKDALFSLYECFLVLLFFLILAKPYFSYPLKSQHVDIGSKLTWRCEATAMPEPVYEWYKDGVRLVIIPGKISIVRNVLTIQNLDIGDNGMYQCSAENIYGKSFTEGQLRVLGIHLFFKTF